MFVHRRDVQIQWGDCDPANIVYYPRYFAMFDNSTSVMFEAAGFSKQDIIRKYGLVGIPMVDTRAKFHIASTHGDWITIESRVESFSAPASRSLTRCSRARRWRSRRSRPGCWSAAIRTTRHG